MQVIIYSKGKVFERYREMIDWNQVVAIADKNAGAEEIIGGKQVILPCEIRKLRYDYITIFSDVYFYDIRRELIGEYFIEPERIVSWRFLVQKEDDVEILSFIMKFIREYKIKSMLDVGMTVIPKYNFSREDMISEDTFVLDGVGTALFWFYRQIYDNIYQRLNEVDSQYELIYINDTCSCDISVFEKSLKHKYRYGLMRMSYVDYSIEKARKLCTQLAKYGNVKKFYLFDNIYFLLGAESVDSATTDVQIYVATHREYNIWSDMLYRPICIGNRYQNPLYLSEQNGDNISYLNEKINECTALYWIWKNTTCAYVGLNHYRRYFYNNEILSEGNYLDKDNIERIFHDYDMILPKHILFLNGVVEEQISGTITREAFDQGYMAVRKAMEKHQPDYLDAFDEVMRGHKAFLCNMFVTRREILNEYCEWLFSFLIETAEHIDVSGYDAYSRRVIGFFAERMMTVWLLKHNLKIKELPFDIVK